MEGGGNEQTYSFCDKIVVTCKHLHLEDPKLALYRVELVHHRSDIVVFLIRDELDLRHIASHTDSWGIKAHIEYHLSN